MTERKQFEIVAREARPAFVKVAGEETYNKEIIFALQALRGSEYLQKSNPDTIRNAVTNIALTGATLNPALQQAFLIPRRISGVMTCCLDFSYRGLIKIAVESGSVYDISAVVVHEGDEFYYEMGLNPDIKHVPINKTDKVTHVYAIATIHHGIKKFEVMTVAEVEKIRKTSQFPNSLMWEDFYGEACKKTVIKRLYKLLPQTDRMSTAVHVVNQHEGIDLKDQNNRGGNAAKLQEKFEETEEAEIKDILATETAPVEPEPTAEEKKSKENLDKQKKKLAKGEEKKLPTPEESGNLRPTFKRLLSTFCEGDMIRMVDVLKEVSVWTPKDSKNEVWIKSVAALDTSKDGWIGTSLRNLKKKMAEVWGLPDNCPYKVEDCQNASIDSGLATCVVTGAQCPLQANIEF